MYRDILVCIAHFSIYSVDASKCHEISVCKILRFKPSSIFCCTSQLFLLGDLVDFLKTGHTYIYYYIPYALTVYIRFITWVSVKSDELFTSIIRIFTSRRRVEIQTTSEMYF